jgi:hypothetical protein
MAIAKVSSKMRDECLNGEVFDTLGEVEVAN